MGTISGTDTMMNANVMGHSLNMDKDAMNMSMDGPMGNMQMDGASMTASGSIQGVMDFNGAGDEMNVNFADGGSI